MHEVLVEVQILQDFAENLAYKKNISFVLGVILSCFVNVMTIDYSGIPFANVSMCKQCPQVKNDISDLDMIALTLISSMILI